MAIILSDPLPLPSIFFSLREAGGAVASWLVRSSPNRAIRVRALAGDSVEFLDKKLYSHSVSLHPGL